MPKRNRIAALAFAACLLAPTALADGKDNRRQADLPAPLAPKVHTVPGVPSHRVVRSQPTTRVVRQAPVRTTTVNRAPQAQAFRIDTSGFTGGVGAGVDGGYYGGGGGVVVLSRPARFSGVLSHPAVRFTFGGGYSGGHGGKSRPGGPCCGH